MLPFLVLLSLPIHLIVGGKSDTQIAVSVPTHQEGAEAGRKLGEIVINIAADGSIKVGDGAVDLQGLQEMVVPVAAQHANQPVLVRSEGAVEYQRIVDVIDTCRKAGIRNVSFATQRSASSE